MENKTHLKQLGEQLITASNKTKETEINDKLKDVNDRWQHLFDHIETRSEKKRKDGGREEGGEHQGELCAMFTLLNLAEQIHEF